MSHSPAIRNFHFGPLNVRCVMRGGEPWFVGVDVCRALELGNPNQAMSMLDPDEKGVVTMDPLSKPARGGGPQRTVIISEAGVYRLVFSSRKASAERFKRWLAHEVLPALRRTGTYTMDARPQHKPRIANARGNQVRHAKMQLVQAALRLDELGIDPAAIDMRAVVDFGRSLPR